MDSPAWHQVQILEDRLASMKVDAVTHVVDCQPKRDTTDSSAWQRIQALEQHLVSILQDVDIHITCCDVKIGRLDQLRSECLEVYRKHPVDALRALRMLEDRIHLIIGRNRPGESIHVT